MLEKTKYTNTIKDILKKELNLRRIEFDFSRIGAPSVLAGSSEVHLKNTVYFFLTKVYIKF